MTVACRLGGDRLGHWHLILSPPQSPCPQCHCRDDCCIRNKFIPVVSQLEDKSFTVYKECQKCRVFPGHSVYGTYMSRVHTMF